MNSDAYILVTRVRDEEKHLPGLFRTVESQTVRPALWMIVDHDSRDGSPAMIADFIKGKDWIESVKLKADEEYGLFCHARPLRAGFDEALKSATEKGIDYRYLGVLDADIEPEKDYFEKIMRYIDESPETGISGGRLYVLSENEPVPEDSGEVVRGGARLYRRECFEAIGGRMPESAIWDTETDVLAGLRGWKLKTLPDVKALHKRKTASRKGILRGYWRRGRIFYYANYHPVSVLLTSLYFMLKPPFIHGFWFFTAYVVAWFRRGEQSTNPEIRDYFWNSLSRLGSRFKKQAGG